MEKLVSDVNLLHILLLSIQHEKFSYFFFEVLGAVQMFLPQNMQNPTETSRSLPFGTKQSFKGFIYDLSEPLRTLQNLVGTLKTFQGIK